MAENEKAKVDLFGVVAGILRNGPLYHEYTYTDKTGHQGLPGSGLRCAALPKFKMYCNGGMCKQETWWTPDSNSVVFGMEEICKRTFKCNNCNKNTVTYFFIWKERQNDSIFVKVGQYPALEERISDALSDAFSKDDAKMYRNALRMRNFNLGLAAVAYLRRVVENKINDILEILHEAAIAHNAPAEILARHEEMKAERRFSVKVDYAGELLPPSLRPKGLPNPMAVLHDLASDGLHARSDEECVAIFDKCRTTFEYVFGKVRIEIEDANKFLRSMVDLTQNKTKV
ncbi:MAG TPA: hypothetical protein VFR24_09320 [Candidatus Angelobacter sp.]|nr:hypothetical protein [Candidatus Angelobacter sp.]